MADLREASHLAGLGGEDPLTRFSLDTAAAFLRLEEEVDRAVAAAFGQVRVEDGRPVVPGLCLDGPSATWTYLVYDDPFRNQLASLLGGPGNTTLTIGAALYTTILFLAWALLHRFRRRPPP